MHAVSPQPTARSKLAVKALEVAVGSAILLGACAPAIPTDVQYDVVSDRPHALALAREMTSVGCLGIPAGERAKTRLAVGIALPSGDLRHFDCGAVARDSVQMAMDRYTVGALTRRTTTASMSETEWWELDFPLILEPPSEGGDWLFIDQEQGWGQIPPWTLEYYCEAAVGGGYYMIKCWEWIPSEGGGGGGEDEEDPGPTLGIVCNGQSMTRGTEITCIAQASSGTITSKNWSFVPDSGQGVETLSSLGSADSLKGRLVASGTLTLNVAIDGVTVAPAEFHLYAQARTFNWGTPVIPTSATAGDCFSFNSPTPNWGWTVPLGTCDDFQAFYPDPSMSTSGATASSVTSGPNAGYVYVASFTDHQHNVYNVATELSNAGVTFTMTGADTLSGGHITPACYTGSTPTRFGTVTDCMNSPTTGILGSFGSAALAHEQAHVSCAVTHTSAGRASTAPNQVEALVGTDPGALETAAAVLVKSAGEDVIFAVAATLHAAGGEFFNIFYYYPPESKWQGGTRVRTSC